MLNRKTYKFEFTNIELNLIINALSCLAEEGDTVEAKLLAEELVKTAQKDLVK